MLILTPSDHALHAAAGPTAEMVWVRSGNGQLSTEHGRCAASLLPTDAEVVLALPVRALSWHRVAVPKVAPSRLRAVLDGLLEERLLAEPAELHFAIEPGGRPGHTLWVAACDKPWLRSWLQALEAAGRPATRIVPMLWPTVTDDDTVHWAHDGGGDPWLASASAQGVVCLPLAAAAAGVAGGRVTGRWLADPAVAQAAEQTLGHRCEPWSQSAALLRSTQSAWNLAQFDLRLSAHARRGQRWRQALRQFRSAPAWRPARWGLSALLLANLIGLNAAAWHERQSLGTKRLALSQTLQQTFPQVTLVLDAPLQMQRELDRLQQSSGQLSNRDLEAMLSALGQGTVDARRLTYRTGELRLEVPAERLAPLTQSLAAGPWQADIDGPSLRLRANAP